MNLSPKAYWCRWREVAFGPDYHPHLVAQKIRAAGICWLRPAVQTAVQVAKAVLSEHYIVILPFEPKNLATLEQAMVLMEAYTSAEAGAYLIPKGGPTA